jgi:anti-sigma factor (TIGR02949 family)
MEATEMTCKAVQIRISAYLDGELSSSECREVRSHLAGCGACRTEVDAIRDTKLSLARLKSLPAPPELEERLVASLSAWPRSIPRRSFPPVFAFAAVALACAALALFFKSAQETRAAEDLERSVRASELARDQAYMERSDPLSSGSGVIAVNYGY